MQCRSVAVGLAWIVSVFATGEIPLCAQSGLSFDVASLKPVQASQDSYRANLGTARNGEVVLTNTTLSDCLRYAYGITNDAQIAGPDWIRDKTVRFDIVGKAPADTPVPQLLLMLQNLLLERFQLVLHREPRELAVMALVVGKNGPRFREAGESSGGAGNQYIPGRIVSNRISMQLFVTLLSRFLRQSVLDLTGLKGSYEIKLEWTPDIRPRPVDGAEPVSEQSGASIFAAIQEQLGLKLESRKGPLEVLVIDRVEKTPIGN